MYRDRKNSVTLRWLMIVCLAAVLLFFVSHFSKKANAQIDDESIVSIREAIRHAAVQCYVVEGAYPVDLDYLKEFIQQEWDQRIYGEYLQKELAITKQSAQGIQLQLKELDEYEKRLRARRENA